MLQTGGVRQILITSPYEVLTIFRAATFGITFFGLQWSQRDHLPCHAHFNNSF